MAKKYQELEFTDNFMFSNTLYNNTELCKELLELILDIPISRLEAVDPEKSIKTGANSRGVRFDVYVKDENETRFDLDMQIQIYDNLPKRSRYYHRMLDAHQIREGNDYNNLKESYVIFICKNPIKKKLGVEKAQPIYYYEYINKDNINDKLKDGSHIVFVNCSYRGKDISDELKNFFNYIKTGKATGNDDNFAHRISEEVAINRENEEWEEAYMTFEEIVKIEYKKGIHQGKKDTLQYLRTLSLDELKSVLEKDNEEILELVTESKNNY